MSTLDPIVYIIDDDQAMIESLTWIVESIGLRVKTHPRALDFLDEYNPQQHGCLLLDVRMPGMSGPELQARLNDQGMPTLPIIFISGHGDVPWALLGRHNVDNALAAIAAAAHAGVTPAQAIQALSTFKNVKRRLEVRGEAKGIVIYDDFAHHPTAIATTLAGLRARIGSQARLIAVLEFGSYTMRSGVHKDKICESLIEADRVICKATEADWGLREVLAMFEQPTELYEDVDTLVDRLVPTLKNGDHVVIMSNSGFGGIHQKMLDAIAQR